MLAHLIIALGGWVVLGGGGDNSALRDYILTGHAFNFSSEKLLLCSMGLPPKAADRAKPIYASPRKHVIPPP